MLNCWKKQTMIVNINAGPVIINTQLVDESRISTKIEQIEKGEWALDLLIDLNILQVCGILRNDSMKKATIKSVMELTRKLDGNISLLPTKISNMKWLTSPGNALKFSSVSRIIILRIYMTVIQSRTPVLLEIDILMRVFMMSHEAPNGS